MGCIASQPLLACFHEVLRPFVVNALRDTLPPLGIMLCMTLPGNGRHSSAFDHCPWTIVLGPMADKVSLSSPRRPSKTILISSSDQYCLRVARLISLTRFSPGLLRVPVVCLIFHSSVVAMSQEYSPIKLPYLDP